MVARFEIFSHGPRSYRAEEPDTSFAALAFAQLFTYDLIRIPFNAKIFLLAAFSPVV